MIVQEEIKARPFIKWVGGKRQLLSKLLARLPSDFKAYHEPFIGGGALFFELASIKDGLVSNLSDKNKDLINVYLTVKNDVDRLMDKLNEFPYDEKFYYEIRKGGLNKATNVESAARFIYLNKTGYNGLYRVNSKGIFNVPFGRHRNPTICDQPNLKACSYALSSANIFVDDFTSVLKRAKKGDLVYFDPPYFPVSKTSNFTSYEKSGFGIKEHEALSDLFSKLDKKGCFVMLSNSFTTFTESLYKGFNLEKVSATRLVNSNALSRGKVQEILVRNY